MRSPSHMRTLLPAAMALAVSSVLVHDDGPGHTLSQSTKNRSKGSPEKLAAAEAKRARKAAKRVQQLNTKDAS